MVYYEILYIELSVSFVKKGWEPSASRNLISSHRDTLWTAKRMNGLWWDGTVDGPTVSLDKSPCWIKLSETIGSLKSKLFIAESDLLKEADFFHEMLLSLDSCRCWLKVFCWREHVRISVRIFM